jgi:4-hydroxybenzoate polyprenyltransferase
MAKVKKISKSFFDELVFGGHLIALGAVGICLTFIFIIEEKLSIYPLIIVYFLTFVSLLHNRYEERDIDFITNPKRTKFLKKYFKGTTLMIFIFLTIALLILMADNKSLFFLLLLMVSMYFYTKKVKKLSKKIFCLKNIAFSLIVSFLLIFISFYYSYDFLNLLFLSIFYFCFLRMLVNTIFLDIKDVESDEKNNLKTFPIIFGENKTILFLEIITLISGILIVFSIILKLIPTYSLMLLFTVPYTFYYLEKSKKKENFCLVNYVLADAEFILWPVSIIIGKNILLW